MEDQQQQQQQPDPLADAPPPVVVKVRWKPNEEQLRMLVRLFEEEGDTINKQRIKEIAVELGRQGDVTEANVHNWFHNRKARAKRKQKLMQQNDGESEVDTDVDSKGKRSKLDHAKGIHAGTANGALFIPEFSDAEVQRGIMMRQPLRLPSDAVNLNSRMYENSMMLSAHQGLNVLTNEAGIHGNEKYRFSGLAQDTENHMIEAWRPHTLTLHTPFMSTQRMSSTESLDRSSESKTITDDASTESEDIADSRAWTKSRRTWRKKGKGTMIRRPLERTGNGRKHGSSRKSRIREIVRSLKRNSDTYERDLKALFVEVVRRLGAGKAKAILSRLTSRHERSSPSHHPMDSGPCSSTASLPRQTRRVSSSSPSNRVGQARREADRFYNNAVTTDYQYKAQSEPQGSRQKIDLEQPIFFSNPSFKQKTECSVSKFWGGTAASHRHEITLANSSRQQMMVMREISSSSDESCPMDPALQDEETDGEKEDYRIVWSSQKKQDTGGLFSPSSFDMKGEDGNMRIPPPARKEKPAKMKLELPSEGEKTNVPLTDGKPTGPTGSWWNSILRHTALLFLDISIPHIALQPEQGLMRIREYMESKFEYSGGTLDDAYVKKQVAKALNFRRHKVMRLIEQGASRPGDVSEDQWDSLIKYYADPKRKEKSEKQRAALKALNMNNHHNQQQQQILAAQAGQQQQQVIAAQAGQQQQQVIAAQAGQQQQQVIAAQAGQQQVIAAQAEQQQQQVIAAQAEQQQQQVIAAQAEQQQVIVAQAEQQQQVIAAPEQQQQQQVVVIAAQAEQQQQVIAAPEQQQLQQVVIAAPEEQQQQQQVVIAAPEEQQQQQQGIAAQAQAQQQQQAQSMRLLAEQHMQTQSNTIRSN